MLLQCTVIFSGNGWDHNNINHLFGCSWVVAPKSHDACDKAVEEQHLCFSRASYSHELTFTGTETYNCAYRKLFFSTRDCSNSKLAGWHLSDLIIERKRVHNKLRLSLLTQKLLKNDTQIMFWLEMAFKVT